MLTSAFAIKNTKAENLKKMAPADIEFKVNMNLDLFAGKDQKYSRKQIENSHFNVVQRYEKKKVDLNKYLKESCEVKVYRSPKLTFAEFCGDTIQDVKEQYPFMLVNTGEDIVTISDYNRLMELFGGKKYTLAEDEYMVVANFDGIIPVRNRVLSQGRQ